MGMSELVVILVVSGAVILLGAAAILLVRHLRQKRRGGRTELESNQRQAQATELRFKFEVRENLKKASTSLFIVNVFNSGLESTIARMNMFCVNNKYNNDAMVAIGDLMQDLSNLYSSLGDIKEGEKFRTAKIYIHRVADQLEKLENSEVGLGQTDCVNGDLTKAAEIMDELATLIEEVGLDALEKQLGVDF